jgi:hypothetical protein
MPARSSMCALVRARPQLLLLARQSLVFAFEVLTTSAVLGQRDYLPKIRLGQSLQLTLESGPPLAEILLTNL